MHYVDLCTPEYITDKAHLFRARHLNTTQQNVGVYCQDLQENPATSTTTTLGAVDLPEEVTDVSAPRKLGSKHCALYFITCHVIQICFIFFKLFYHSPH
jgi:hypothetical protein